MDDITIVKDNYRLLLGDCLNRMKEIPDGSVDMVLCDLPYGITACPWDSVLPLDVLWKEWERIVKSNGIIVLFGTEPFSTTVRSSNLKRYKYDWIWKKPQGTGNLSAKKRPLNDYENVMVFCFHTKGAVYNPQMTKGTPFKGKDEDGFLTIYGQMHKKYENKGTRYPKRVIEFGRDKQRGFHPSQKPVALLEYLIRTYTNPGETVLDNCMGSGSTGVACINTGRKFVGIEKDEKYFGISVERIERAVDQQALLYTE